MINSESRSRPSAGNQPKNGTEPASADMPAVGRWRWLAGVRPAGGHAEPRRLMAGRPASDGVPRRALPAGD